MKMKSILLMLLILLGTVMAVAQTVSVPAEELTEQQKQKYLPQGTQVQPNVVEQAHKYVGLGEEIGKAFNGGLSAITDNADKFAKTGAGKFTMAIIAWKVIGNDALHFAGGLVEAVIFLPLFIWSYRKMCLGKRVVTSVEGPFWSRKKTYQVIAYSTNGYDLTPRVAHALAAMAFTVVWLFTVFSG